MHRVPTPNPADQGFQETAVVHAGGKLSSTPFHSLNIAGLLSVPCIICQLTFSPGQALQDFLLKNLHQSAL